MLELDDMVTTLEFYDSRLDDDMVTTVEDVDEDDLVSTVDDDFV